MKKEVLTLKKENRKSLGCKILKKESIQSISDWVTKSKKIMSDIKANKVDYNFYEITSDLEEEIERTDDRNEKEILTDLLHRLNNAYSKITNKDNVREDKELLVENEDLMKLKDRAEELSYEISRARVFRGRNNDTEEIKAKQKELDSILEKLWVALEDVPFIEDENSSALVLDGEYLDFPKGTTRNEIWKWFDIMYSRGVAYLVNDFDITAHRVIEDKECLKEETLTWEDIMDKAEGTTFGQQALKVKDTARDNVEQLLVKAGVDIDKVESVEDEIEKYCKDNNIKFDTHGNIITECDKVAESTNKDDRFKTNVALHSTFGMDYGSKLIQELDTALEQDDKKAIKKVVNKLKKELLPNDYNSFIKTYYPEYKELLTNMCNENKKVVEEIDDMNEAFYEKICRAYVDTMNLEWVTTNPENNSVVHGYFAGDDVAEKYDYGAKVTPDNFKEVVYEDTDQESPVDTGYYEYETWEDFYEGYVKDEIAYDMNDIGVYDSVNDTWDFYISEEDLTKLGLWNEDMKSEFIGESKKVVEDYGKNVFNKVLSIEDNSGDTIMQFKVANDGSLYGFDHCEVADEEDDLVRIQQVETFGNNLDESKKVESLSFDNIMDYRELIDGDTGDLVDTFFFDHKITEQEDKAIADAVNKAKSEVEDYDNYTVMEYINKIVPIKQSLSAIYSELGPSTKKQIKY